MARNALIDDSTYRIQDPFLKILQTSEGNILETNGTETQKLGQSQIEYILFDTVRQ